LKTGDLAVAPEGRTPNQRVTPREDKP